MSKQTKQTYTLVVEPYKFAPEAISPMVIVTLTTEDGDVFEYVHQNASFAVGEIHRISVEAKLCEKVAQPSP